MRLGSEALAGRLSSFPANQVDYSTRIGADDASPLQVITRARALHRISNRRRPSLGNGSPQLSLEKLGRPKSARTCSRRHAGSPYSTPKAGLLTEFAERKIQ